MSSQSRYTVGHTGAARAHQWELKHAPGQHGDAERCGDGVLDSAGIAARHPAASNVAEAERLRALLVQQAGAAPWDAEVSGQLAHALRIVELKVLGEHLVVVVLHASQQ